MSALRVVVADDSVLLREGLVRLLGEAELDVIGAFSDGDELLAGLPDLKPDLAVLDVRMPPTFRDEGVRAAIRARELQPTLGILLLSQYVEVAYASELLASGSGGVGYLLKDRVASLDELQDAIERIAAGGTVLDPEVVSQLLGRRHDPLEHLTTREREVIGLMAEGAHQCGHRREPVHRHGCRREERDLDLPEARSRGLRVRPSARPGRAGLAATLDLGDPAARTPVDGARSKLDLRSTLFDAVSPTVAVPPAKKCRAKRVGVPAGGGRGHCSSHLWLLGEGRLRLG